MNCIFVFVECMIYVICDKFAYCFRGFVFGCKGLIHSIKY